jgi:hypothetical protein
MRDRNGGKAGARMAPPLGALPPIAGDVDNTISGYCAQGVSGTRARMEPENPEHRANIGMSNVLKKADPVTTSNRKGLPTKYEDPDCFGPKSRHRRAGLHGAARQHKVAPLRPDSAQDRDEEKQRRREARRQRRQEDLRKEAQSAPTGPERVLQPNAGGAGYADKHRQRVSQGERAAYGSKQGQGAKKVLSEEEKAARR